MAKIGAWFMLLLAILTEITGTSLMKNFSMQGDNIGYVYMFLFIGFSYFALSKAVVKIPISTAYATWEGLGLIGTAFIAWLIFNETMPLSKIFAFFIILTGLVMIKIGTKTDSKDDAKAGELDE